MRAGMKIFKRKTDDEIVQNLRRDRNIQKVAALLCLLLCFLWFFIASGNFNPFIEHVECVEVFSQNTNPTNEDILAVTKSEGFVDGYKSAIFFWVGIYCGGGLGITMGGILIIQCLNFLFLPRPQQDLLLKYYDELKNIQEDSYENISQTQD